MPVRFPVFGYFARINSAGPRSASRFSSATATTRLRDCSKTFRAATANSSAIRKRSSGDRSRDALCCYSRSVGFPG
jgi:hypothetical protein